MKCAVDHSEIVSAAKSAAKAVQNKPTHPILACLRIEVLPDLQTLEIRGYNLKILICQRIKVADGQPGAICVPVRAFIDLVSKLGGKEAILLEAKGELLEIQTSCGHYSIAGQAADQFPGFEENNQSMRTIDIDDLRAGYETTGSVVSDDQHAILTGVSIKVGQKLQMCATDGHRLNVWGDDPDQNEYQVVVPPGAIDQAVNMESWEENEITMTDGGAYVKFSGPNTDIMAMKIEGDYPDYNALFPKQEDPEGCHLEVSKVAKTLERMTTVASWSGKQLTATIQCRQDVMQIESSDDYGQGTEQIDVEMIKGTDWVLDINPKYLLEGLKVIKTPKARLNVTGATKPVVLVSDDHKQRLMIMPIQRRSA